jgi:hypothetical protein
LCISLIASTAATFAMAADYTFTKIFDSNDPLPNGNGYFSEFTLPSLDSGNVAFAGRDGIYGEFGSYEYIYSGVYSVIDGNINLVADSNMVMPGSTETFEWLAEPIIDAGNVAFAGGNRAISQNGIYTDLGGSVRVVADPNTPVPGGTGTFNFLPDEDFGINNGVVAITAGATSPGTLGVYADINGTLSVIADGNTPAPDGSGNFDIASFSGMNGSDVAFSAFNATVDGEFLNSGGTITSIIDSDTLIPGSTETFSFPYGEVDVAAGTYVIVSGPDYSQTGLYSNVGGTLHLVAEIGDLTPDGAGNFTFFDNLAVDLDELAFLAVEDGIYGNIFRYADGVLDEVISIGDSLDGKSVIDLNMWDAGFDASAIAFKVSFGDGSSGIYLAEVVPVPPALWLFGSGLLGLISIARRKSAA